MAERFVLKNLTKELLPVLVPLNRLHVSNAVLPPEGKQEFSCSNVDIRAGHGTVRALEKKGHLFVGELGPAEEPAPEKKAPKEAKPKPPAPAPKTADAKDDKPKDNKGNGKKKDKGKDKK